MKELWICKKDNFSLNIGGGTILQFQVKVKRRSVTFWGWVPGTLDFYQRRSALKLFGFMISWSASGRGKHGKTWYFNKWRYKRERLAKALQWEQEGFPNIAVKIRSEVGVA